MEMWRSHVLVCAGAGCVSSGCREVRDGLIQGIMEFGLQGEVKGGSAGAGTVGVLLIPEEEPIVRAFREARRLQFAIECTSTLKAGDPIFFNADQVQQRLTFPRYKVFLYNTTNKTVEANLFLTFTN